MIAMSYGEISQGFFPYKYRPRCYLAVRAFERLGLQKSVMIAFRTVACWLMPRSALSKSWSVASARNGGNHAGASEGSGRSIF